jgi:hypothetical protein
MKAPDIVNDLFEDPIKAVRLPDGRLITASLAKILGISVPPQDVSVPVAAVSVPLPDELIYDTETD